MSKVWLEAGEIVASGGKVTLCADCPCDTGTGSVVSVSCCGCTSMPGTWELTVSGIANNICGTPGGCLTGNGTFRLEYKGGCNWESPAFDLCGFPTTTYLLTHDGTNWTISVPPTGEMSWSKSCASFNCLGNNTMTGAPPGAGVCSWPATVQLNAVV